MVLGTIPADGENAVGVGDSISIQFSGPMLPTTLAAQIVPGPCSGSIRVSSDGFATCLGFASGTPLMSAANSVATFKPAPGLSFGSTYFVRVTNAALGADGASIDAQYTSSVGFVTDTPASACAGSLVICQIYASGGNSGAAFKNDFVEIHNRGDTPVELAGWSIQYASAGGSSWLVTPLTGAIAAGGYYLIQGASGANGGALPTPDVSGTANMSASAGNVALVQGSSALSGICPIGAPIVDFVGYGTATMCFEGSVPASAPSNAGLSLQRAGAGCVDTNANKSDFSNGAVIPRNSANAWVICSCPIQGSINESGLAAEIDFCNVQFPASISIAAQTTTPLITGRIYEAGVTEAPGVNGGVLAEVGFGPVDVNPTTQSGWQFFPTAYGAQMGNADEYGGSFTAPVPGSYRYAFRASLDGMQWTYCDSNGAGSSQGATFEVTQLPVLTVTP